MYIAHDTDNYQFLIGDWTQILSFLKGEHLVENLKTQMEVMSKM